MFHTVIYKNLSNNQKQNIINLIKQNFPNIPFANLGMESSTLIILNYENDKIIGCVCLLSNKYLKQIVKNVNNDDYNLNYEKSLFLYNFCVDEEYRNKKIGSSLIDMTLELCKKIGIDNVYCHAENEISRNLFMKKGFIEDKIINNNIYLMSKFI